eukprot:831188-Prymnesium_polylepis.1
MLYPPRTGANMCELRVRMRECAANLVRTCASSAGNFRESVANLREFAQPWWRTFANPSRIRAYLRKIIANMCQMRVVPTS